MKASIQDKDILHSINPNELETFLRTRGWHRENFQPERFSIWVRHVQDKSFEVLIPLNRSYRDYSVRMAEVLRTLEKVENQTQFEVLSDIQTIRSDVIKIGVEGDNFQQGSMPLKEGVKFIQQAYDLLLAAACSTVIPREVIPARKPVQASNYMETVKLGQSEVGSYIITLHSPIPSLDPGETLSPFERDVTRTLFRSISHTIDVATVARQYGNIHSIKEAVPIGVSANLCEALVRLQKETGASLTKFNINWSPEYGIEDDLTEQLTIPAELTPFIQEAAEYLYELASSEKHEYRLVGRVEALEGDMNSGGMVKIKGAIRVGTRLVRIILTREDYKQAYVAHGQKSTVSVYGTLTKVGRFYYLEDPTGFTIES